MKKHLEQEIERINDNEQNKTRKEISYHDKMLNIWKKNEEKFRKQMTRWKTRVNHSKSSGRILFSYLLMMF